MRTLPILVSLIAPILVASAGQGLADPTETPLPAPVPTPPPFIAYQDTFNDPDSGWDESLGGNFETEYVGGEYRIQLTGPDLALWRPARPATPGSVRTQCTS